MVLAPRQLFGDVVRCLNLAKTINLAKELNMMVILLISTDLDCDCEIHQVIARKLATAMNRVPDVRVHDGRQVGRAVQRRPGHVQVVEAGEPVIPRPHVFTLLPRQILLPEVVHEAQDALDAPVVGVRLGVRVREGVLTEAARLEPDGGAGPRSVAANPFRLFSVILVYLKNGNFTE